MILPTEPGSSLPCHRRRHCSAALLLCNSYWIYLAASYSKSPILCAVVAYYWLSFNQTSLVYFFLHIKNNLTVYGTNTNHWVPQNPQPFSGTHLASTKLQADEVGLQISCMAQSGFGISYSVELASHSLFILCFGTKGVHLCLASKTFTCFKNMYYSYLFPLTPNLWQLYFYNW